MELKLFKSLCIVLSILCSVSAFADVSNVLLRVDSVTSPTNPFMACLKNKIIINNSSYDFVAFPGTETIYDNATPKLIAKTDVVLKEKSSGKNLLFKIVLTSTDTSKGWSYYMDDVGITIWSTAILDTVEFSLAPDNSPILKTLLINDCPGSF